MKFNYRHNLSVWTVCMSLPKFNQISEPSQDYNANFYSICFTPLRLGCKRCSEIKEVKWSPQILCSISFPWHHCLNLLSLQLTSQCVLYTKQLVFKVKNLCVLDCGYSHITDMTISHKKNNVKTILHSRRSLTLELELLG